MYHPYLFLVSEVLFCLTNMRVPMGVTLTHRARTPPSDLDVEKYVEGKKEEKEERKNNAKFSGHYVHKRTQNMVVYKNQFKLIYTSFEWEFSNLNC